MTTRSPLAMCRPPSSKSLSAVRRNVMTGGGPADEFLDGGCDAPFQIGQQEGALLGEVAQRLHGDAGGVPGGVVAGEGEQQEEGGELLVVQDLAVGFGLD